MPPAIKKLVAELGLRYRPGAQADLAEHAAALALLATDLADIPPRFLEKAIRVWASQKPFMPKASELIEIARRFLNQEQPSANAAGARINLCEKYNARLRAEGKFHLHWIEDDAGQMKLEPIGAGRT